VTPEIPNELWPELLKLLDSYGGDDALTVEINGVEYRATLSQGVTATEELPGEIREVASA
jgi:hypothetical protein